MFINLRHESLVDTKIDITFCTGMNYRHFIFAHNERNRSSIRKFVFGNVGNSGRVQNNNHLQEPESWYFAFSEKQFVVNQPLYRYLSAIVASTQKLKEKKN
jgi:hypothetical protein